MHRLRRLMAIKHAHGLIYRTFQPLQTLSKGMQHLCPEADNPTLPLDDLNWNIARGWTGGQHVGKRDLVELIQKTVACALEYHLQFAAAIQTTRVRRIVKTFHDIKIGFCLAHDIANADLAGVNGQPYPP